MAVALYMLDTNTCSFAMRGQLAVLRRLKTAARSAPVAISAMVYSELVDGTLGPRASPRLPPLLADLLACLNDIIPWDKAAADRTAFVRATLRKAGTPIGHTDSAIAGHALALDAVLVTNNTREFARVPGLAIEDWATG
ncbi:MAG: hypothetical protein LBI33_00865 [Propionibacteriaceae bacterium]|jgi:tRNA(fMet)-specific endonuclease VapC|nr:hypothetical protein [Propionibacteriaceae bacterium]